MVLPIRFYCDVFKVSDWLGGPRGAGMLGNPAVDFLGFHKQNWSTAPGSAYGQWLAGIVLKAGWRF
jgi:hypothetical protein